jgi:hypothetical protein
MGDLNSSLYIPLFTFLSRFRSVYPNNMKLTLRDGYFICPSTQSNRALAGQKNGIILNDLSLYSVYKKRFGPQVRALEHFYELNGIRLEEDNNTQFATYMALLTYLIAFYKRRLDFVDIDSLDIKWDIISHFVTADNVDRMYESIILAIAKKGLSQRTAREIALGKLQDPRAALENVLNLLNSMELPYHVADPKK